MTDQKEDMRMVEKSKQYFECPKCGWVLTFRFAKDKGIYVSTCPFCKNRLEIEKEEYEDDGETIIEFTPDF